MLVNEKTSKLNILINFSHKFVIQTVILVNKSAVKAIGG